MINRERMAALFRHLVETDSVSKEEQDISNEIIKVLKAMDARVVIDGSKNVIGGNTGNLTARINGNTDAEPMLLCAHMDTVEPGRGVKAVLEDGVFRSDGTTVLGADDKSAIAIILETLSVLKENSLPHGPIELVFTVCEEIGLLGAKHLDYSLLGARFGYVLDSADMEGIVTRAPAANRLEFTVYGKDAHAGANPELGINAIVIASRAIAGLNVGRIDEETTCNIGMIEGGIATNIVPNLVKVTGEVRSHDEKKLEQVTSSIVSSFKEAVAACEKPQGSDGAGLDVNVMQEFPRTHVPEDHPVVTLAREAAKNLGTEMKTKSTGGGADANIFFGKGIITGVLGTGMTDVHTVRESVKLDDMVQAVELLLEIIRLHAEG